MNDPESQMDSTHAQMFATPSLLSHRRARSAGKMRPMVLLWALGVPLPIVLIIFMVRGCS